MGNYEHVELTATVETEVKTNLTTEIVGNIDNLLDELLKNDIRDALDASGNQDSFIYVWTENKGGH